MNISEEGILRALAGVNYPGFSRDIVSSGVVTNVRLSGGTVRFEIVLAAATPAVAEEIRRNAQAAVESVPGVEAVEITVIGPAAGSPALKVVADRPSPARGGALDSELIPEVRHTVAVASGKGGVGKSTVAVNLAVAMARHGARVGLLDADIYGPSIPLMMGMVDAQPRIDPATRRLLPFDKLGIRFMSLGFLVEAGSAVIWRGPMVMKALEQLLRDVAWGALDVLVVDMPPGTGDAQLTMSQRVRLAGAVVVTTPQDVALADAIKAVAMFRKVDVPVLGVVENMSYFHCPHCSQRTEIFGHGGGRREAERLDVPFLGEVPLDPAIRASGDDGEPVVSAAIEGAQAGVFMEIAGRVLGSLAPAGETPDAGIFARFRKAMGASDD
jgi:ATP-binding protein involved in chromosome partitioning